MSFGARMKAARKNCKMTQTQLGEMIGVAKSTIAGYEKGASHPDEAKIIKIMNALKVDANYLWMDSINIESKSRASTLPPSAQRIGCAYNKAPPPIQRTVEVALEPYMNGGDGTKKAPPNVEGAEFAQEISIDPETVKLRLYTQTVAAGLGNYQDDEDYEIAEFPTAPKRANIAVRISGDSMEPEYHDGDIIFVETESVLRDGEIGIFSYDGNGYIKQLRLNPARLVSLNSGYDDILIMNELGDMPLRTIGRVVGKA